MNYKTEVENKMIAMNKYRSIYGEDYEFKCVVKEVERMKREMNEKIMKEAYLQLMNYGNSSSDIKTKIIDIAVIIPGKVVEVTFGDGQKEKMICSKEDKYDLRECLFIAIAKHLYKRDYTQEGVEYKANELKYPKKYVKIVDTALKEYNKKCEDIKRLEDSRKAELEHIDRKRAKREAYKVRREAKRRAEQIAIQREAYIQAMEYVENKENDR